MKRLLPSVAAPSIAVALLACGCLWGMVRDADTGAPLSGASVSYTDSEGYPGSITANADGLYAFDQASGGQCPWPEPPTSS